MRIRLLSVALLIALVIVVLAGRGGSSEPLLVPEALRTQAAAQGTVRVIVRLNAPFAPEGLLASPAHVAGQRQMLAGVQIAVRNHLRGVRHRIVREFNGALPLMAIEASPEALQMLAALRGIVAGVEEDVAHPLLLAQSVPLINGNDVWAMGADGTGQIVAVLDTGVQKSHPFLSGKVIAEACFSSTTATSTSVCPGGAESAFGANAALPCAVEGCDHGTHVAGIAAGRGSTFSGVARGASVIAIQVFSRFDSDLDCGGFIGAGPCIRTFTSDQIEALNYVHAQRLIFPGRRIAAANMSLGGGRFTSTCDVAAQKFAIDQLRAPHPGDPTDPGVATVISAGNSFFTDAISLPACISTAIPVASSTKTDGVSSFTNMASPGLFPSLLFAPGSSIQSSVPTNAFAFFDGTSMAAPHVAGGFAVLRQIGPSASVTELLNALKANGEPILDTRPVCSGCGSGGHAVPRIDLLAAAAEFPPNLVVQTLTAPASGVPGANVSVTASIRNTAVLAGGASNLKLYLSNDSVITTADRLLGTIAFGSLSGGVTSPAKTLSVQIPASVAPAGTYFIGAIADADHQQDESSETDNTKSVPIEIVLADLAVTSVTGFPRVTAPGANISVTHTVRNVATAPAAAPASFSGIYLGVNQSVATAVGGRLALVSVPALTAGATSPALTATGVNVPVSTPVGRYFVLVRANDTATFLEGSAGANVGASGTPILVGPDLTVTSATTGSGISPGGNLSVTSTIKNQGGQAVGGFEVAFALVPQAGGSDIALGPGRSIPSLAAGASAPFTNVLPVPSDTPAGTYKVRVTADATAGVAEADESNNTFLTGVVTVGLPDLAVQSLTFAPPATLPGGNVTVTQTVKNLAPAPGAAGGSFSRLRMGPGQNLSAVRDLGLVSVPALASGALATISKPVTVPGNAPVGLYYLSARADDPATIAEPDDVNNLRFSLTRLIVGPDVLPTAASTVTGIAPGANVSVAYTLKNQGGQATGVDVSFALIPQPSGTPIPIGPGRTIAAFAAGATTAFSDRVLIPANALPMSYRIRVRVDPTADADPSNNSILTGTVNVARSNLKVQTVTFAPAVSFPGGNVTVTHTVKNVALSPGNAGGSSTLLRLGTTPTASAGDLGFVTVPAIPAGGVVSLPKLVTVPPGTLPGRYFVLAAADATALIVETNDDLADNLGASATRLVVGPDVVPTAATVPAAIATGGNLSVTYTLKNQGGAPAGPFNVSFVLVPTGGGPEIALSPGRNGVTIPAGGSKPLTDVVAVPIVSGPHRVRVIADSGNDVVEADEGNNSLLTTGSVNVIKPNLTVPPFTFSPARSAPGGSVTIQYSIRNAAPAPGNAPASGARLFLSVNQTASGQVVNFGTIGVPAVGAGMTVSSSRQATLPVNLSPGRYFFGTQADPNNVVSESDESETSNFGYSTTPIVVGPDIVPMAATVPAAVVAGGNLSVTYTLRNQGGAPSGPFAVGFAFVPVNAVGTPILPDVPLGSSPPLPSIPAGGTVMLGQGLTIPSAASGPHRIRVIVDPGNGVFEADEGNNALLTAGNLNVVLADLAMQSVTATPAAVAPTGNISVTQVIRNLSPAPGGAAATTSRLYLSPEPSPVTALTSPVIGDVAVPAIMGLGTATVTRSLRLPSGTVPGTYWVYARANAASPVPEAGPTEQINNLQRTLTPIVVGPDLTLTTLTAPAAASPNLTIPVTSTVRNLGGQGTNGSVVRFFLSPTGVLDGSQIPIGVTSTATLAPGASFTTISRVTIPGSTSPGGRFLLAQADGQGIAEANATNNVMVKSLNVLTPNLQITSITIPTAAIRGRATGAPNVSVVVKNAGTVASAPFDVKVFANRDGNPGAQTAGTGDLLYTRTVGALLPNAATTVTAPIVIPEGTAPNVRLAGNYFVSATADPTGAATGDTSLGDNVLTLTTKVLPVLPDMTRLNTATIPLDLQPACLVEGNHLDLQGPVDFTSQSLGNPSSFSGTATLADTGSGFNVVYAIRGTVRAVVGSTAGVVAATFTFAGPGRTGTGTINGSAPGLDLTGVVAGQQTGLPGCTFTGTVDIVR